MISPVRSRIRSLRPARHPPRGWSRGTFFFRFSWPPIFHLFSREALAHDGDPKLSFYGEYESVFLPDHLHFRLSLPPLFASDRFRIHPARYFNSPFSLHDCRFIPPCPLPLLKRSEITSGSGTTPRVVRQLHTLSLLFDPTWFFLPTLGFDFLLTSRTRFLRSSAHVVFPGRFLLLRRKGMEP